MNKIKNVALVLILALSFDSYSQTTVNSLQELIPFFDDDNVNIKLAPRYLYY